MADSKDLGLFEPMDTIAMTLPSTISEEEKELAANAQSHFDASKFKECLTVLKRLLTLRPNDTKVKQNKAVADYYASGFKFTDVYLNTLDAISENIDEPEAVEDLEHCVHYYNKALLYYHMCQYQTALSIGEKLVQFVVPMEDGLARKFAFLMIELYLRTFQPEKALNLLTLAEKIVIGAAAGNGSSAKIVAGPGTGNGSIAKEKSGGDKPSATGEKTSDEETWKTRLALYKARSFVMLRSMKPCKREMKALVASGGNSQAAIYLKAYFAYSAKNPRKALKVLNTALNSSNDGSKQGTTSPKAISCGESLASMYYNALGCIHNGMEKHALAALYFRKALDEDRKAVNEVRKNLAPSAKGGATPPTSFNGIPGYCIGLSRRPEILYNLGLQLLQSGKALGAFDCLIEVVQVFHSNPRLWLRLAEACIMASRSSNEDSFEISQKLKILEETVGSGVHGKVVFGRGLAGDYNQGSASYFKTSAIPNATLEFASLCLRNSLLLLPSENSVSSKDGSVLDDQQQKIVQETAPTYPTEGSHFCNASPSNPVRSAAEVASLRCSTLAAAAYVALRLNDSVLARQHARALLAQPRLSGAHKFLGRLYLSEALLNLDDISEAIQQLNPDLVDDVTISPSEGSVSRSSNASSPASNSPSGPIDDVDEGKRDIGFLGGAANRSWWPGDVARAKAVVHLNLSVAHVIRGESQKARLNLDKAEELFVGGALTSVLATGTASPAAIGNAASLPADFLQARIYLDLLEGDRASMKSVLKRHFGHITGNAEAQASSVKWS